MRTKPFSSRSSFVVEVRQRIEVRSVVLANARMDVACTQLCTDRAPTLNCKPSACMTFITVAKLGLPCSPKAL